MFGDDGHDGGLDGLDDGVRVGDLDCIDDFFYFGEGFLQGEDVEQRLVEKLGDCVELVHGECLGVGGDVHLGLGLGESACDVVEEGGELRVLLVQEVFARAEAPAEVFHVVDCALEGCCEVCRDRTPCRASFDEFVRGVDEVLGFGERALAEFERIVRPVFDDALGTAEVRQAELAGVKAKFNLGDFRLDVGHALPDFVVLRGEHDEVLFAVLDVLAREVDGVEEDTGEVPAEFRGARADAGGHDIEDGPDQVDLRVVDGELDVVGAVFADGEVRGEQNARVCFAAPDALHAKFFGRVARDLELFFGELVDE